jgi:hypothetical protein
MGVASVDERVRAGDGSERADLRAQVAILAARLDEQAVLIANQQREIAAQRDQLSRLMAPVVSMKPATPPGATMSVSPPPATRSRRAMLARVLGITAAGGVAALVQEPARANAQIAGTVAAGFPSTASYGLAAAPANTIAVTSLGSTTHGVIGNSSANGTGPAAEYSSGVFGTDRALGVGVQGITTNLYGVYGKALSPFSGTPTVGSAGVKGLANTVDYSFGVWGTATSSLTGGVFGENSSTTDTAAGIYGYATASTGAVVGLWGRTQSASAGTIATLGEAIATSGPTVGVLGRVSSPNGIGVKGTASGNYGVQGVSTSAAGVFGTSTTAYGVQGLSTNAYGVSGNSTTQAGVWGSSYNNVGVLGSSTTGVGVNGVSVSSNGVNGVSDTGIAVYGSSQNGTAGRFDGNVVIQGNLTVSGNFPHTAAVPSSDGTLRRLYGLNSAEAYYEDLGQGSLTNGVGMVTLDPAFVALVRADAYQVFLTAYGDSRGLYVSNQTASGFEVREVQGGTSSVGFGYRVVARPRDLPTSRLDRVTLAPSPAQPKLDRVEPLDVPATLREAHHNDGPGQGPTIGQPAHQQDGR